MQFANWRIDASVAIMTAMLVVVFQQMLSAAELVTRESEVGTIVGYKDTPPLPWTDNKYCVHDPDRPVPRVVIPRPADVASPVITPPADAEALFDGESLDAWKPNSWRVENRVLEAGGGALETKEPFGDCQLHIEFAIPTEPPKNFMNRGNSGVLLMGKYELQIFDSWHEHPRHIYPDGQAAAIYGQTPPLVNACLPPGVWQAYDVIFTAPGFEDGKLIEPARVTMYHNGVLVHLDEKIHGEMTHRDIRPYRAHPARLPLVLQGHSSPVRFRNIWIRELDLR